MEPDFSQWAQAEILEIPLKHEKNSTKVRVVKHQNRLPRGDTGLEIFKTSPALL